MNNNNAAVHVRLPPQIQFPPRCVRNNQTKQNDTKTFILPSNVIHCQGIKDINRSKTLMFIDREEERSELGEDDNKEKWKEKEGRGDEKK